MDTKNHLQHWDVIEKSAINSIYFRQHLNSISLKSSLQPVLIVGDREGVGLMLKVQVQGTNIGSEIVWNVIQSSDNAFMAQGRAYWFATFPVYCEIRVTELY